MHKMELFLSFHEVFDRWMALDEHSEAVREVIGEFISLLCWAYYFFVGRSIFCFFTRKSLRQKLSHDLPAARILLRSDTSPLEIAPIAAFEST